VFYGIAEAGDYSTYKNTHTFINKFLYYQFSRTYGRDYMHCTLHKLTLNDYEK